ncbi:MAG: M28 family peptidase [Balneolaceae bacterium]|nr:M28 family peptidase [Balneolaceae bacterium]
MKLRILVLSLVIIVVGCSGSKDVSEAPPASQQSVVSTETDALLSYQDEITTDYLRTHLSAFSADSMEGRETAMPGQKKAAKYLAEQYEKLGLKPVGDNNSYYQKFDLTAQRTDSIVFMTYKKNKDGSEEDVSESKSSKKSTANYIRQYGGDQTIEGEVVFAGYGMNNSALNINHLQGTDIQGKWVMVFGGTPPQVVNGDTLYSDQQQLARGTLRNLIQQGVAGILIIPEGGMAAFKESANENSRRFGEVENMQLAYRDNQGGGPAWGITTISPQHAAKILDLKTGIEGLNKVRNDINQNIKTFRAKSTGYGLTQIPYVQDVKLETENLVAYMEGADPQLKDEVVVLSAHYDHVGIGAPDSTGDAIYNGANDDGSGTIGVLSAARAFAEAKENGVQPRRSILFLSVSGEEKGLLGSRYYSDHPIFPIEKTVANINTDMIGRVDPEHRESGKTDYVYIIGAEIISSDIDSLLKAGNARSGELTLDMRYNDLNDPNQFYRRSDHWNFGRFGVPFVFFFNGVHEDYHRPSDEIDKINFPLLTKTARSMYATTVMVANADSAPKVDNQEFIEITKEN